MTDALRIRNEWLRLRSGAGVTSHFGIPTIPLDVDTGYGPVRLALGTASEPRLLLPLSRSGSPPDIAGLGQLDIAVRRARLGDQTWRFLDIACESTDLEVVFSEVTADVLQRISGGNSVSVACLDSLTEFRKLLVARSHRDVDDRSIRGLAAELLVLERMTQNNASAIRLWLGPTGDRHDFRGGERALEVKSSTRAAGRLTISSVDQLEPPSGGALHLVRLLLESSEGGPISVSSIFDGLLTKVENPDLFIERLGQAGCDDPASPEWNRLSFIHAGSEVFEVRSSFPRIVPSSFVGDAMPAGTNIKSYEIDLSLARDCQLDESETEEMWRAILSCLS